MLSYSYPLIAIACLISTILFICQSETSEPKNSKKSSDIQIRNIELHLKDKKKPILIKSNYAQFHNTDHALLDLYKPINLSLSGNTYSLEQIRFNLSDKNIHIKGIGADIPGLELGKVTLQSSVVGLVFENLQWKTHYPIHKDTIGELEIKNLLSSPGAIKSLPNLVNSFRKTVNKKNETPIPPNQSQVHKPQPKPNNPFTFECESAQVLKSRFYFRCNFKHPKIQFKHFTLSSNHGKFVLSPPSIHFDENVILKKSSGEIQKLKRVQVQLKNGYLRTDQGEFISLIP